MALIQSAVSLLILGFLYRRMIKREIPTPISKSQAIVPVILGVVSLLLSLAFFIVDGLILGSMGYVGSDYPPLARSVIGSLAAAGLPEEAAKLLMIIITVVIFRSKIRNVYEYILIGAAVGLGFTLFEEFLYGSDSLLIAAGRLITVAAHMLIGIIMGRHLGIARYYKITGKGSASVQYILAVIVPVVIHTLYDSCIATNKLLEDNDETIQGIGAVLAVTACVGMFVLQFIILGRTKKNAGKYCEMLLLEQRDKHL
ncbi:MAG: PrsW family intramembrane metalloprotease [Ruminiclostridium sp.]|nr:PrsW family intramembrane metalloprotease [Ruminiclostridium sp.]